MMAKMMRLALEAGLQGSSPFFLFQCRPHLDDVQAKFPLVCNMVRVALKSIYTQEEKLFWFSSIF